MARLALRDYFMLSAICVLSIVTLSAIGLATHQLAEIRTEVTRILAGRQEGSYSPGLESTYTLHDQDGWMCARSFKDWKWIIVYSSPARIKYADVQTVGWKLSALQRSMMVTLGLGAAAAGVLFVLLTSRGVRSLRGVIPDLTTDTQAVPAASGQAAGACPNPAEKPSARGGALDQALHEAWDQRPGQADPSRKTAGTKAPRDSSPARPDEVIPMDENELKGF